MAKRTAESIEKQKQTMAAKRVNKVVASNGSGDLALRVAEALSYARDASRFLTEARGVHKRRADKLIQATRLRMDLIVEVLEGEL